MTAVAADEWVKDLAENPAVQQFLASPKKGWNPIQNYMRRRQVDSALQKAVTAYNEQEGERAKKADEAATQGATVEQPMRAWAMGYSHSGIAEKRGFAYNQLRVWADTCQPVTAIINRRIQQVSSFSEPVVMNMGFVEKPGFRIRQTQRDAETTPEDVKNCAALQQFMMELGTAQPPSAEKPYSYVPSLFHYLSQWTRDSLTLDWVATRFWKPKAGKVQYANTPDLAAFTCIDAAYIRPVARDAEAVKNNVPVLSEYESQRPSVRGKDIRFVRIPNDASLKAEEQYTEREVMAYARNTRTDERLYGMGIGELEQSFSAVEGWLFGLDYNLGRFRKDSLPRGFLQLVGKVNEQQLQSFRLEWMQLMMGNAKRWTIPVIAGAELDAKWTAMDLSSRDMEYHQLMFLLAVILHANFGIHPEETGYQALTTLRPPLSESSPEATLRYSQDWGLRPLLKHIESFINSNIIWRLYPDRRYMFEFVGLGETLQSDQIENWAAELDAGLNIPANIWKQRDLAIPEELEGHPAWNIPMPFPKGMEYVDNLQMMAQQAQAEQQAQQQAQVQTMQQGRDMATQEGMMSAANAQGPPGGAGAIPGGAGQGRMIQKAVREKREGAITIVRRAK